MTNLLIVDDSKSLLELFPLILEGKGFNVRTLQESRLFWKTIELFNPEIILLDVWLGENDGRKLCKELKQNESTKHISVILISANPELLVDADQCMANDVLEKPFDIDTVTAKVMNLVRQIHV